ncbi:hypothetical protein M2447_002041 [Ereboglobus sp. PH5-10]|uniref:hypothetical protein n=1 Tax=Ereboglobus sp. PH5-10 TaxID=2940629 RepID=UPI002407755F|nr:hypothetical protein [Ereboglobus sp. PH5-10]MDF9827936.1 hypothetical protein [Ereboglobus sp. PH5-10]
MNNVNQFLPYSATDGAVKAGVLCKDESIRRTLNATAVGSRAQILPVRPVPVLMRATR